MDGLEIVHHPVHRAVIGVDVCLDGHACAVFDGVGEVLIVSLAQCFHPHLKFVGTAFVLVVVD